MIIKEEIIKFIGVVRSPFRQKFGVPRQPGLSDTVAEIEIFPPYHIPEAFRDLEGFSHIWVIWWFHEVVSTRFRPLVRPPRLGGNVRTGIFASRSMFRPNRVGLSVVRLLEIRHEAKKTVLTVAGADMMDGTPVVDIKPYIRFADAVPDAQSGYAGQAPAGTEVIWLAEALVRLEQLCQEESRCGAIFDPGLLKPQLEKLLGCNPSPAYHQSDSRVYGVFYECFNIKFKKNKSDICIIDIERVPDRSAQDV